MNNVNSSLSIKGKIKPVKWNEELSSVVPSQYENSVEIKVMDATDAESLMITLGSYEYTIEQLESVIDQAKRLLKAQAVFSEGIEKKVDPNSNLKKFKVGYENGSEYHVVYVDARNHDHALELFRDSTIAHTDITHLDEATPEDLGE